MEQGRIEQRKIVDEMQNAFLDYSMSVIVDRALPDVRDGLKPVHRRILVTLNDLGLKHTAKYRKSAKVSGDVSGNYHPHGEAVIYPSMVHLVQDFKMRYPMIDGQGNFGSVDGDPAAAMRYTEARMTSLAEQMLADLDKDTVDYRDNYDGTRKEPVVLPAKIPQLLVNGTLGIAVGMATSIPPHNLGEVIDATVALIDDGSLTVADLLKHVKGPDFPTGGIAYNKTDIQAAYETGRGGVVVRAHTEIVENKQGNFQIVIDEIPFQLNKSTLIEKIADLVKEKKLEGIKDLRDESGREGMRIVVDLKRDAFPKKVLNQLFKQTSLQTSFSYNMLALIDGIQPKVLDLKMMLEEYIKHREVVVKRRAEFELKRAKDRAHILEGLSIALDHIEEVIKVIKKSKDKEVAHAELMKKFKLSPIQATAILEMRLQTLAGLERKKIEDELDEKRKLIAQLEALLASRAKMRAVIKSELLEIKEKYADERKTRVVAGAVGEFVQEDLIADEEVVITMTHSGYIKRMPATTYKAQKRGGKGVVGMKTKEEDVIDHLFSTSTHSDVLFFTNTGRVFLTKAYEIPETSRQAKGSAIVNFLQLGPEESITGIIALEKDQPAAYLVMATDHGMIKKVAREDFAHVRRSGLIAMGLKKGDALRWVRATDGKADVFIATRNGQAIRFKESTLRAMGRSASGVKSMKLKGDDAIIGMETISKAQTGQLVLTLSEHGYGKCTPIDEYKVQGRAGSGIKTASITKKTGKLVTVSVLNAADRTENDLLVITKKGQALRTPLASISELGRSTQGVRIIKAKLDGDTAAMATIV